MRTLFSQSARSNIMMTEDNPDAYEIRAIKNFESKKKRIIWVIT